MAVRSWFAASATPAPPPKASLRSSPPPRSARLDSTISLGRLTSPDPTPGSNFQIYKSPPVPPPAAQYPAPGNDNRAAAEKLSNTLLRYSHRDWDQAQRADPLCDATRRYIKLGYPNTPPFSLCDHLGVIRTLKMLERFYWWVGMEACTKWWVRRCLKCQARKTSRLLLPCPKTATTRLRARAGTARSHSRSC